MASLFCGFSLPFVLSSFLPFVPSLVILSNMRKRSGKYCIRLFFRQGFNFNIFVKMYGSLQVGSKDMFVLCLRARFRTHTSTKSESLLIPIGGSDVNHLLNV